MNWIQQHLVKDPRFGWRSQCRKERSRGWRLALGVVLVLGLGASAPGYAVIFYATDDPNFNTTAPSGELAGSGWEVQGRWGNFIGTPVAPRYFMTAAHVGGAVGDPFYFHGVEYTTLASFTDPNSDLRIWRVCGAFPQYAALYDGSDEIGKSFVVFGRGTRRGDPVTVPGIFGEELKGWRWGSSDGVIRWGENLVAAIEDGDGISPLLGNEAQIGDLLVARFNAGGGPNQAHLSQGDSGGGVFIKQDGAWKLAGINFAVSGRYNTSDSGSGFQAATFDEGGLYKGREGNWSFTPNLPADLPGSIYITRISSKLSWINSVLSDENVGEPPPVLQSAFSPDGPFSNVAGAGIDPIARTFTFPRPISTLFYRLRACGPVRITGIQIAGENLVIRFEFE